MNSTIEKSLIDHPHQKSGDMTSTALDATIKECELRFKYLKVGLNPFLIDRRFASQLDEII
jgi:hypothetical protein